MADAERTSILLVDDLPERHLAYEATLAELGQELVTATSGEEALRHVLKKDFAVILLDVNMPGINGFETAHLIRGRRRSAHTPIIFMTAFADEVQTTRGYATGAVDYISTPFVPEVLRAKVRVFVELFQMRQQVARQAGEQARREAAEESARRAALLAEASRSLANSLDFEGTLAALARLAVPDLAGLGLVALRDGAGVGRVEAAWAGPTGWVEGGPARLAPWAAAEAAGALAGGTRERIVLPPEGEPLAVPDAGAAPPAGPALFLPLAARGAVLGVLVFAARRGKEWRPEEVSLAAELAGRAAVALDNTLLVRDIQEADRRKNEFLAMLSHELRNPLAPVRTALSVMQASGLSHPTLDWAREVIGRQVDHLVRLVDDLLDVSRITRGKIRLRIERVDAAEAVAAALETSRPLIDAHNHRVEVDAEVGLILEADRVRLSQVLSNLLNNAAKYTPDGGHISVSARREGGEAVFRVRDTGAGIPAEMLSKVFDLFAQVNRSLDRSEGGLGIGLTLVRRLVEMQGGRAEAASEGQGKGSEFTVRLPALAAGAAAEAPGMAEGAGPRPSRVLVVDDNEDAADALAMLLRVTGHETLTVYDGPSALEAARKFVPQVVLLDIGLPGLDGYEVARRLRDDPGTAGVLIIAVSGYGQEGDRATARASGFDHHLTKPVDLADLRGAMAGRGVR